LSLKALSANETPGVAEYPRFESTPQALTDVLASVWEFPPAERGATVKVLCLLKRHNWRMETSARSGPVQLCDRLRGIRPEQIHILG